MIAPENESLDMPAQPVPGDRPTSLSAYRILLYCLFALSGAAGLVYEVVWVRETTLVLGASTHAVTVILAAFMLGLGLGSWLLGKVADRLGEDGLARCYVLLEVAIGSYALLLPWILQLQENLYISLCRVAEAGAFASTHVRLALAFLVFLVPTCLMGATLPVLSRYLVRSQACVAVTVSRLYAFNTLGAMVGTMLAGYLLLPLLGNSASNAVAACANFGVALGFWLVHRTASRGLAEKEKEPPIVVQPREERQTRLQWAIAWGFAISGAAAMLYEVAWTRTLTMVLGTTTFAFTTMLATFLLGIALGSALYPRIRGLAAPATLFLVLQFIVAFSVILSIPLFERLPFVYLSVREGFAEGWTQIQVLRFLLAALIMLVPTLALGSLFPVVSDVLVDETGVLGRRLGRAYGLNTLGGVLGATLGGLVLIPAVGMQKTIIIGALANLTAGTVVVLVHSQAALGVRVALGTAAWVLLLGFAAVVKPWSPRIMSSGVYVYASRYYDLIDRVERVAGKGEEVLDASPWQLWKMAMRQYALLYYHTGKTATVSVMEREDGVRFLSVDGKTDASTGPRHDMKTQVLIGQLPLLLHSDPDRVFVVGLGSGVTVGSVLTHNVRVVDCAEFSEGVIEAAKFFSHVNHDALGDPRLRLAERDARNFLLTSGRQYDAIVSQPSNPWISGQSSLFSLDWYELVWEHLSQGGMFCQWIPAYQMSKQDVEIIVHTLRTVFEHVTAWNTGSAGELILLARKGGRLRISYEEFLDRVRAPRVAADIERLGYDPETLVLQTFLMSEDDVTRYVQAIPEVRRRVNTDDLLITEFSTPKDMIQRNVVERFVTPEGLHGRPKSLLRIIEGVDPAKVSAALES